LVCHLHFTNLETDTLSCRSKAVDKHWELLDRYRRLSQESSVHFSPSFVSFSTPPSPCSTPANRSSVSLTQATFPRSAANMSTLIKINPFSGGNTDLSADVEEYQDDMKTAAL